MVAHLIFQQPFWPQHMVKEELANVSIHSRQWVIQHVDVCIAVYCPGQADSLFLAPTQVNALEGKGPL